MNTEVQLPEHSVAMTIAANLQWSRDLSILLKRLLLLLALWFLIVLNSSLEVMIADRLADGSLVTSLEVYLLLSLGGRRSIANTQPCR